MDRGGRWADGWRVRDEWFESSDGQMLARPPTQCRLRVQNDPLATFNSRKNPPRDPAEVKLLVYTTTNKDNRAKGEEHEPEGLKRTSSRPRGVLEDKKGFPKTGRRAS